MEGRPKGNEYRITRVCVDSYENSVLVGQLNNPYLQQPLSFESLAQFLLSMESLLEQMQLPQSFTALRAFDAPLHKNFLTKPAKNTTQSGKLATFSIRMLFRQNTSWQGSVTWLEGEKEESFRSALELIFLIDNALRTNQSQPGEAG